MGEGDHIKEVSHTLGVLSASYSNLEKQMSMINEKLDCVHTQTIITNESVKSAHKRLDSHEDHVQTINKEHKDLKKVVNSHERLKWTGIGIFGMISFSLGLLGSFGRYIFGPFSSGG